MVHLDVEDQVEELLRQLSYAMKNQLVLVGGFGCDELVLYGIRAPIIGPFREWKPPILMP